MKKIEMNKYLIFILTALILGCSAGKPNNQDGIIKTIGDYPSPNKIYILKISKKPETLIAYEIQKQNTGKTYKPEYNFSHTMRWFFYWKNDSELWVHSSDIGLSYWVKNNVGNLEQKWITEKDKLDKAPEIVFENLPKRMKK